MMAGPELSRRLGEALGTRTVTLEERDQIVNAAAIAQTWDELTISIRALVEEIEARPGWLDE